MYIYLVRHAKNDDRYRGRWSDLPRCLSTAEEALVRYPGLFFNTLRMNEKYPNGESPDDFYKRIKKWFDDMICKYRYSNENILIVTHGGVIDIICHIVKDIEWTNKNKSFKASNAAIYKLNCEGELEFEIENYNDFLKKDENNTKK